MKTEGYLGAGSTSTSAPWGILPGVDAQRLCSACREDDLRQGLRGTLLLKKWQAFIKAMFPSSTKHTARKKKNNKMHSTAASFLTAALNTFSRVEQFPPALHVFSKTKMEI